MLRSTASAQFVASLSTPLGGMLAVVDGAGRLKRLEFAGDVALHKHKVAPGTEWDETACADVATQVAEYFASARREFELALAPEGTQFQRSVWRALTQIPYGTTLTYGELARRLELPAEAARAVGSANGANPIAIVVPCHRVIGSNGSLTGYAYGLDHKRRLLELEGALTPQLFTNI